jgi:ribose-phosphate pyrophosphokinase
MKILNLTNKETSDIKFEVSSFPDGQQQVAIKLGPLDKAAIEIDRNFPVTIKTRINNWSDLEKVTCAVASLKHEGVTEIHLYAPYLIGARSDRFFGPDTKGYTSNNYIKDVIAPAINDLKLTSVTVLDPHSDVLEACLNNFHKETNVGLVRFALNSLYGPNSPDNFILVSPDMGALKKIYSVADAIGYKGEYVICSKFRNWEGELSRVEVPIKSHQVDKDFILIDDICDGGKTFIEIGKKIKETVESYKGIPGKRILIVTHGIFSQGLAVLGQYFDEIYCTNSYSDNSNINQLNVLY